MSDGVEDLQSLQLPPSFIHSCPLHPSLWSLPGSSLWSFFGPLLWSLLGPPLLSLLGPSLALHFGPSLALLVVPPWSLVSWPLLMASVDLDLTPSLLY
ncbi:hypothetical protein BDR04DRAFT_1164649 [Suillus decipiens]|nr:hypothetical protein BDR04DRAFT_1164653 [Suillus decipiens]KAG2062787.1 hypothetical protein BDR04DRAFT_1164649 [Suillus decipiens]